MENILKYIFLPCLLIYTGFLIWKTYFGDPSELKKINTKLKIDNQKLQTKRDSLNDANLELSEKYDSVSIIIDNLETSIAQMKKEYELLENKSKKNIDSANKWKQIYLNNRNKISKIKNREKETTNQETLDFFKNYK